MSTISTTLNNFSYAPTMIDVFSEFPHDYEFDENVLFEGPPVPTVFLVESQ
jgi:hypothetical protein